jgi:hypothetical protein
MLECDDVIDFVFREGEAFGDAAVFAKAAGSLSYRLAKPRVYFRHCPRKTRVLIALQLSPSGPGVPDIRIFPNLPLREPT